MVGTVVLMHQGQQEDPMVTGNVPDGLSSDVNSGDAIKPATVVAPSEWMNGLMFTIGGIAVVGLLVVVVGIFVLDKITKLEEGFIVGVIVVGAAILAFSGILWMAAAVLMIVSMAVRWRRGRRRSSE